MHSFLLQKGIFFELLGKGHRRFVLTGLVPGHSRRSFHIFSGLPSNVSCPDTSAPYGTFKHAHLRATAVWVRFLRRIIRPSFSKQASPKKATTNGENGSNGAKRRVGKIRLINRQTGNWRCRRYSPPLAPHPQVRLRVQVVATVPPAVQAAALSRCGWVCVYAPTWPGTSFWGYPSLDLRPEKWVSGWVAGRKASE